MTSLLKKPSAWLPLAFSAAALGLIAGYVLIFGVDYGRQAEDEGLATHLFQMLMLLDVLGILVFAITWLPIKPKQALGILAWQILGIILALGTLFILEW